MHEFGNEGNELARDLVENLAHIIRWSWNEPTLLKRMERFFSPKPAKLAGSDEEQKELEGLPSATSRALGGPPDFVDVESDSPPPVYDTYSEAALHEIITAFRRCHRSVCSAQLFFISYPLAERNPEFVDPPLSIEWAKILHDYLLDRFWDECENCYIRLASYWDRIGQLLDFAFFNIRQYERDGFSAVMERIRSNYLPLAGALASSDSWQRLWKYARSEQPNGFKWLARRRNLLVHSLHMRSLSEAKKDHPIFVSSFNHLEQALQEKLRVVDPQQELEQLHIHLGTAAGLLVDALQLCLTK